MAAKLPPSEDSPKPRKRAAAKPKANTDRGTEYLTIPDSDGVGPDAERDRAAFCAGVDLDPGSLVGSWFLRFENGEAVWWGIVVGEPQAGKYLLEIHEVETHYQRVVPIETLMVDDDGYEFRFYNTDDDMRAAFAQVIAARERTT